ncbi:hypothetical protein MY4824_005819 [Beauveria thailandica]
MSARFGRLLHAIYPPFSSHIQEDQQEVPRSTAMSSYRPTSPRELPPHRACTCDSTCVRNVETQLISGLGVLIDYLNKGNGEPQLSRLRRRAELWCETYFGSLDYTIGHLQGADRMTRDVVVPQSVLDVHPRLFDVRIPSQARLNPPPVATAAAAEASPSSSSSRSTPSLVSDNDTEMEWESDANSHLPASIEQDASAGDTIQKQRRRGDHFCHQFPPYTEPVLLPDEAIEALLDRYDRHVALYEACRQERLLAALYEEAGVGASVPAEHRNLLFDRRVRAADLRGSPLLHHIPELLACLARLPPAPAFTQFLRNKQRRVDEHDVEQQIHRESLPYGPMTQPCPLPGLAGSVRMPRLGMYETAWRAEARERGVYVDPSVDWVKEAQLCQQQHASLKRRRSSDTDDSDSDSNSKLDSDSDPDSADSSRRAAKRMVVGIKCW